MNWKYKLILYFVERYGIFFKESRSIENPSRALNNRSMFAHLQRRGIPVSSLLHRFVLSQTLFARFMSGY